MIVGNNSGKWDTSTIGADIKPCTTCVRLSQTEIPLSAFQNHWNAGCTVLVDFAGPFNSGGVQQLDPTSVANNAYNWYVANTNKAKSPVVEILNEPAIPGSGWGSGAFSQANATAYRNVVTAFCNKFRNGLGSNCPDIVASYDGGRSSDPVGWGRMWWNSTVAALLDGITMHSYASDNALSTSQSRLTAGHNDTGKRVYVTELGWTTAGSLRSNVSESVQASHISSLAQWMHDQGWVALWTHFNFRDFSGGNTWGVTRTDGSRKPSWAALHSSFQALDDGTTGGGGGGGGPPPPPPPGSVAIQLNPSDHSKVQITSIPSGTQMIHIAEATDAQGSNIQFPGQSVDLDAPFGTLPINFTPPPDHPAVQMVAFDSGAYDPTTHSPTGNPIGDWTPWVLTTPSPAQPLPGATTDAVSGLSGGSVTYNGEADTHGVSGGTYHFERVKIVNGQQTALFSSPETALSDIASDLTWAAKNSNFVQNGANVTVGHAGFTNGRFLLAVLIMKGVTTTPTTLSAVTAVGGGASPAWTQVQGSPFQFTNAAGGAHTLALYYRFAGASEADTVWQLSQTGNHVVSIHASDGVNATAPLSLQNADTGARVVFAAGGSGLTAQVPPTFSFQAGGLKLYGVAFTNADHATFPTTTPATTERDDLASGNTNLDTMLAVGTQPVTGSGFSSPLNIMLQNAFGLGNDVPATFGVLLNPTTVTAQSPSYSDSGLDPGQYQVRLAVTAGGQTGFGDWVDFAVAGGPVIDAIGLSNLSETGVTIGGRINPLGESGDTWKVQISTDQNTWTDVNSFTSLGATTATTVSLDVTNLTAGTGYFLRFVAHSATFGDSTSSPVFFTTSITAPPPGDLTSYTVTEVLPDDRLALTVTGLNGVHKRWGPDELDGADVPVALNFQTAIPNGFQTLTSSLLRRIDLDYPDLALLGDVNVYGPGAEVVWQGRHTQFPRDHGDTFAITPSATGWAAHLLDDPQFAMVYVDRQSNNWNPPGIQRQTNLVVGGFSYFDPSQTTGGVALTYQQAGGAKPISEAWYTAPAGCLLGSYYYNFSSLNIAAGTADANENLYLEASDDDVGTTVQLTANLLATATGGSAYFTPTTATRFALVAAYYAGTAASGPGVDRQVAFTNLTVYGNHGLTVQGDEPGGVYLSDIVRDLVSRGAPLLDVSGVEPNTIIVPHYVADHVTPSDALLELNNYAQWDWGVYNDRKFFFRPPDPDRLTWSVRLSDGAGLELEGEQSDDVYNGVVVTFTDTNGVARSYGPPGSNSDYTDPSLQDTSEGNPVNQAGIPRKWLRLDLGFTTTPAGALTIGQAKLGEQSLPQRRGTVTVKGFARHPTMGLRPAWAIRAGDFVRVEDHPADVPRKIITTDYDHASRTNTLTVGNTSHKLDAVIQLLQAQLVGLGAS